MMCAHRTHGIYTGWRISMSGYDGCWLQVPGDHMAHLRYSKYCNMVGVYIYIYIMWDCDMYVYIYTYTYIYIITYIQDFIYIYVYIYIYIHMIVYIILYICPCLQQLDFNGDSFVDSSFLRPCPNKTSRWHPVVSSLSNSIQTGNFIHLPVRRILGWAEQCWAWTV